MGTTRRLRLQLLTVAVGFLLAGCARMDVSQVIELRPATGLAPNVVADLHDAAENWNVEVGASLQVLAAGPPATRQQVPVDAANLVWWGWASSCPRRIRIRGARG